jgi:putative membrane protein
MMDGGWYWGGGWMMLIWAFVSIIFWAGIITLVIWAIRKYTRRESGMSSNSQQSPLEIVKQRYAKGEITKEQYEQLKKDLSG